MISRLSKLAARMSEEGELGPGVPKRESTPLPTVKKPETWEFSAHPHHAIRAGKHIDLRLGNPKTGIAHSFVLPRREELPGPGQSALVVPTFDHTIDYMDYTGPISSTYGKGEVKKGRREKTEVYHADATDEPGTKVRFNLYEGAHPEEFSIRKDRSGKWFIHNKTQTRERRTDIPVDKPKYKEIEVDQIDPGDDRQAMMPKLDGSHAVIDLRAGRAPRVFSFREAKKTGTGLIEHTHKMPKLLEKKVPKSLDRTLLRGEVLGLKGDRPIPAQKIGGLLNSKVWKSRAEQESTGVQLKMFPFDVVMHKVKSMANAPFSEKLKVLREVEKSLSDLEVPPLATNADEKINLMNTMKAGKHPLTEEGFVLVDKDNPGVPIKAKFAKDYDVFVRGVNPAKKKGGGFHDRAGNVSYSWTPDGPIAGTVGGFAHAEARDMLKNPDRYVGRVAKTKAMKVFTDKEGNPTAMFQPRFKEWHLDKGDIEKTAWLEGFIDELSKLAEDAEHLGDSGLLKTSMVTADQVAKGTDVVDTLPEFLNRLKPGDVLLSKGSLSSPITFGEITKHFQKLRGASEEAHNWTHAGIYLGKGKIRHAYAGVFGKRLKGKQRVRDHKLKTFVRLGRDLLAVRPKMSDESMKEAVKRAKDLHGRSFSNIKILKAGFLPDARQEGETKKENLPTSVICTSLVGYAYPKLRFKNKSIHTLMPSDIVDHKKMAPVAAFSADEFPSSVKDLLKRIGK